MGPSDAGEALRVAVIIGSTRQGRVGGAVGGWFAGQARRREDIDLTVLDLAECALPASLPESAAPEMAAFAARIQQAEAFVVVTPEYNRSFPASLKQAIDCAYDEWHGKPVGFVSYGCRSRGLYAVEQLRTVFTELHVMTMRDTVSFNLLDDGVDECGRPPAGGDLSRAVVAMLDQLVWWGRALRSARAAEPYIS